jgi:hypothetical protein
MTQPLRERERFNRWQALAIGQLSVSVALLSALSVAGLGSALSLVQNQDFVALLRYKILFASSFPLFFLCAFCSCAAVITRTMDFRLTARCVRKGQQHSIDESLKLWGLSASQYGRLTWFLFWAAILFFSLAGFALAIAVASAYAPLLLDTRGA